MQAASAIPTIKNRRDFLAATQGQKWIAPTLILQVRRRPKDHPVQDITRIGFTVSGKVGGAIIRNRTRRRLKDIARKIAAKYVKDGHDYVVIARAQAATCDFSTLQRDMEFAFSRIHANKKPS